MMEFYEDNVAKIDDSMYLIKDFNVDIDCAAITQEFGTRTGAQVFKALINENVMTQQQQTKSPLEILSTRNNLVDAFYVDSDEWKEKVLWNGINFFDAITRL